MKAILLILILAVVALIAAVQTGLIDISQTRGAKLPSVAAEQGKVSARGGQTPAFEVQTGSVGVGTTQQKVTVPALEVRPPADSNTAAPAQ